MSGSLPRRSAEYPTLGHSLPSWRVFLIAAAAFALAVLAAAPASAQHAYWLRGGVTTVHSSNLNNLEIEIGMNGATFSSGFNGTRTINGQPQATVLGVPSGMTARVCAGSHNVGLDTRGIYAPAERGWIRICTTGDFFEDWQMRVRVRRTSSNSWFNGLNEYTFGPITVRAQNTHSTLALSDNSISENGGVATVTATLSQPQSTPVTITVSTTPFGDTGMQASDYTVSGTTLTFAAGSTTSTGTVTITAVDNAATAAAKTMRISGTITGGDGVGVRAPASLYLRITDDETSSTVTPTLVLSSSSIAENGGVATVTATLAQTISAQVRVWVYVASGAGAFPGGFNLSGAGPLTIASGSTASTNAVTITAVADDLYTSDRTVRVFGQARGGNTENPADVTLTLTDDETLPTAALALSSSSIAENGGETTVTATLSAPSTQAVMLAVAGSPGSGTDFTVSSANTLTIAGGATTSTGTVTITGNDDNVDEPNESVTVSATATGGNGVMDPPGQTLTITDDDAAPNVTLALSDNSIAENGGLSTISATLSHPSSAVSTVTVAGVPGVTVPSGAAARIVIAAGATTSTDTVTITAVDNNVHSGNRMRTVVALFSNDQGTGNVTPVTLTLEEDDTLPVATLAVNPASITENGGVASVTATLNRQSSQAVTITVSATAGTGAVAGDFNLSSTTTLTIAAGATTSTGTVTVTAVDNSAAEGSKSVTVSGTAAGGNNVANPADATLTLTDDDAPTPTLVLNPSSIAENAGVATVTATLDRTSTVAVTVTVAAAPVAPAVAGDFNLSSATTLIFAANATTSTGTVTITAVNNTTDAPNKAVTVSGTSSDSLSNLANNPASVTLTITDDDAAPTVTLAVSPTAVTENAGVSTVSATLSRPSSEATTVTVTAVAGDYMVGADAIIAIAVGMTVNASDVATVTTVENDVHEGTGGRSTTVTATAANAHGVGAVTGAALTLTEDDASPPTVTLALSSTAVTEVGGVATVTATLSGKSSQAVTLTVAAAPGTGTVATDFSLSSAPTLTIAAGATTSTGTVTVTAVDNAVDHSANKTVTVSATVAGGNGVSAPSNETLTIEDDDMAGLAVSPAAATVSSTTPLRTTEAGGGTDTFTVALATEPTGTVTVSVSSGDAGEGTVSTSALAFTTMTWNTAQAVTLTGVDDPNADGNQTYTITLVSSSTADARYNGIAQVLVYAVNADDELGLDVSTVSGVVAEAGGTATFTVDLITQPSAAVTVAVSSGDTTEGRVSPSLLTFSTSNWGTAQTVTVTGVDDDVADGNVTWNVVLDPSSSDMDYNALGNEDVAVITQDDDTAAVVVAPTPSTSARLQTTEAGGTATFTVRLGSEPTGDVVLDVASTNTAEGTVLPSALTFTGGTTGTWNVVQTVTLTGVNDAVDDGDQNYEATLTVNPTSTMDSTYDALSAVTVYATNADDDMAGLAVSPTTSTTSRLRTREDGSQATFTVALTTQPTGAVVLDVASSNTAEGMVSPSSLTFAAADWNTAQTVTLTGVDDDDPVSNPGGTPDGSQDYEVTLTVNQTSTADSNYDALAAVMVYAVNADDELGIEVSPVSGGPVTEDGGQATFTVRLITAPTAPVQVAVSSLDPSEGAVAPATLTFTPTNWNVPQAVTVTAVDDDVDDGDVAWKVRLDPSSAGDADYDRLASEDVDMTTEDDDGLPTVMLALSSTAVTEAGGVATVTAMLSGKSSEAVTVTVATTAVAPAGEADFSLSAETTLTIAAGTTTSTGLVTVTARDNDIDAPDKQITVSATATGGHGVENPPDVTLTLTDDDTAGLKMSRTELTLEEQEDEAPPATATYTVQLETQPTGAVTVTVSATAEAPNNAAVVTFAPPTLTFTMADWATPQSVRVTTVAEAKTDYRHDRVDLTHTVTVANSADSNYASLPAEKRVVEVTVTDTTPLPMLRAGEDTTINGLVVSQPNAPPEWMDLPLDWVRNLREVPGISAIELVIDSNPPIRREVLDVGTGSEQKRYSVGTGEDRRVLDITVRRPDGDALSPAELRAVLGGGVLRFCLEVSRGVREEADRLRGLGVENRDPVLLRQASPNEPWTVVSGDDDYNRETGEICVTREDFSRYAAAIDKGAPVAFGADASGREKNFRTGRAVSDEEGKLPEATGDGRITYSIVDLATRPLPAGLTFRQEAGASYARITGTPTTPTARQEYTLLAEDVDRDTDSITFSIEVKPGIESRDLGLVLAGIGRTLATDAVEILGGRFGSSPASRPQITLGGQVLRLTEGVKSGEGRVKSGGESGGARVNPKAAGSSSWHQATGLALNVARALGINLDLPSSNSSPSPTNSPSPLAGEGRGEGSLLQGQGAFFQGDARRPTALNRGTNNLLRLQPVSAKDLLARSAFELPLTRTGDDGVPAWTLWGRGSAAGFAGQPEDGFKMDGTLYSGYLGVDYRHASLLMGLAVAHSTGEVSYERTGATKAGADVKLTSVLPYVHWQPRPGLGVWSLLGAGWGEMDLKLVGDSQTRSTRLNSWLGAVGGRQTLTTWQGIDLAAKTDAFLTTVRTAGTAEVPEAQGHAQRVRLLVEGRTAVAVSQVSRLEPRLELGARWDSGTAEQGLGAELGGGVAYTLTDWGLSIDAQGRYLLLHEDGGFEDWGASVNVRLDPGAAGQGAYLTVTPVWGQASSGVDQLWSPATALSQTSGSTRPATDWRPGRLEVDLGYGLALSDGQFLTPYGGLALAGPGSSRYRLGSRLALSSSLAVNIEAEQAEQPGQPTAHGVSIRLGWQW